MSLKRSFFFLISSWAFVEQVKEESREFLLYDEPKAQLKKWIKDRQQERRRKIFYEKGKELRDGGGGKEKK